MRLQEWLERRGLTQAEFGVMVGYRQQVVSRWASGVAIPRPAAMSAITRVTNGAVQPADFYATHAEVVEGSGVAAAPSAT